MMVLVFELQNRRGDRNASLLFDFHPIAGGIARSFSGLHRSGNLNGAAKEQQFFGERGLSGVGMRDDAKSPPVFKVFAHRLRNYTLVVKTSILQFPVKLKDSEVPNRV